MQEPKKECLKIRVEQITRNIDKLNEELKQNAEIEDVKGTIVYKYIRCGKSLCKCAYGNPHGPYPHLQWYEDKKLHMKYLNRKILKEYELRVEVTKKRKIIKREIKNLEIELSLSLDKLLESVIEQ